jgi:hypothetical protein
VTTSARSTDLALVVIWNARARDGARATGGAFVHRPRAMTIPQVDRGAVDADRRCHHLHAIQNCVVAEESPPKSR